jgi:methyltransferase (TIGR00027 family)
MLTGEPSKTAWDAAVHRAVHQVLEQGSIFADPLALRLVGHDLDGDDLDGLVQEATERPSSKKMRIFVAVRARFAHDTLAAAVERGVSQVVVLGAGLDTYAYCNPFQDRVRIFEVDHPATQAWKRELLAKAGIPIPPALTFVPIDFERQTLTASLRAAGFDGARQSFFTWLGVVPYLTAAAIDSTLAYIVGLDAGSHVVFDYSDPPETFTIEARDDHNARAERVAQMGEAWITHFEPAKLRSKLLRLGFTEIEDLGPREIAARYFLNRATSASDRGGHILRASKSPTPARF